ncbi:hypothetical protein ID866_8764 [Astraeus odoratus]|nr:hypothetical protein ID866_8764 [Astraeus odoratus]
MIPRSPVKKPPSNTSTRHVSARLTPTPVRSAPIVRATTSILTSSTVTGSKATPHEAMVASQQGHINELVQKTRSLESTIREVTEERDKSIAECSALAAERKSWEADQRAWANDRQKWMEERKAWANGCETIQACHRIQEYRLASALGDARATVYRIRDQARQEQLKRLQRDNTITMLQAREMGFKEQIAKLQEERDLAERDRGRCEKVSEALEARCVELADEVKAKVAESQVVCRQYEQAEEELRRLREALADASASTTSSTSKLALLTTQFDSLRAQVTSIQQSLAIAQDENTQLRTQLSDMKEVKKGDDTEYEVLKKKNDELESEMERSRKRVIEMEAQVEEFPAMEARLQKEKGRVEKLKSVLDEWKTEAKDQTAAREAAETQLATANVQIHTQEQEIADLRKELVTTRSKSNKSSPPPVPQIEEPDSSEAIESIGPSTSQKPKSAKHRFSTLESSSKSDGPSKSRPKLPSVTRPSLIPEVLDSDIEIVEVPSRPQPRAKAKGKRKVAEVQAEDDSEARAEASKPKTKHKESATTKEKGKEVKRVQSKGATQSTPSDHSENEPSKVKPKPKSKKRTSPEPIPKSKKLKSKPARPDEDMAGSGDDGADPAPKKKKRRINIFQPSQPPIFDWDSLLQGEDLGIPSRLSPMKETDPIPKRLGRVSRG